MRTNSALRTELNRMIQELTAQTTLQGNRIYQGAINSLRTINYDGQSERTNQNHNRHFSSVQSVYSGLMSISRELATNPRAEQYIVLPLKSYGHSVAANPNSFNHNTRAHVVSPTSEEAPNPSFNYHA